MPSAARKHCGSCSECLEKRAVDTARDPRCEATRTVPNRSIYKEVGKTGCEVTEGHRFWGEFLQVATNRVQGWLADWLFVVWYWGTFSREGGVVSGRRPLRSFTKLTFYLFIADVKNKTHTHKKLGFVSKIYFIILSNRNKRFDMKWRYMSANKAGFFHEFLYIYKMNGLKCKIWQLNLKLSDARVLTILQKHTGFTLNQEKRSHICKVQHPAIHLCVLFLKQTYTLT